MKKQFLILIFLLTVIIFPSCKVIRQGNVGVKRTLGKINNQVLMEGPRTFNPFITRIITLPIRTVNLEVKLSLPSKEGLNVESEISILYHIDKDKATNVIATIGADYESILILPVFRASAADATAKFMAKDMHTGNRLSIEKQIKEGMMQILHERGFIIESVLLKSIKLPSGLYRAIEEKLEAEQEAQRMEFILQRERQEAERKKVEAEGIRDANKIITEGLTKEIIQYKALEVYRDLSRSSNAKIIIGSGTNPIMIEDK